MPHLIENVTTIVREERGHLWAVDYDRMPFRPMRSFVIDNVPPDTKRGNHAHKICDQVLFCLSGEIAVTTEKDGKMQEFHLTSSQPHGVFIPCCTWSEQHYRAPGSALLVLASHAYDPDGYC